MTKLLIYGVLSITITIYPLSSQALASSLGPAKIIMIDKTSKKTRKATFPHKMHQKHIVCGECHHGMTSSGRQIPFNADMTIDSCTSCHNPFKLKNRTVIKPGLKKPAKLDTFKGAAHANCISCHYKTGKEKLIQCSVCHK